MDLEPRDIHEKEFHDAWRGYNQEEVDDFLDRTAEALDRVQRENRQLHQRVRDLEAQVAKAKEAEEMLKRTLVGAQRAAEEAIDAAKSKADRLVAEAEERARRQAQEAGRRSEQAEREHAQLRREIDASIARLRSYESNLKTKLKDFLAEEMRRLDRLDDAPEPAREPVRPPATPAPAKGSPAPLRATPSRALEEAEGESPDEQRAKVRSFSWRQDRR